MVIIPVTTISGEALMDNGVAQSCVELNADLPICVPAPSFATPRLMNALCSGV
jgi:hypothetical protein